MKACGLPRRLASCLAKISLQLDDVLVFQNMIILEGALILDAYQWFLSLSFLISKIGIIPPNRVGDKCSAQTAGLPMSFTL